MDKRIVMFHQESYPTSPGGYRDVSIPAPLASELAYWNVVSHAATPVPEGGVLITLYCEPR